VEQIMARRKRTVTKVNEVCDALERLAPLHLAQSWDNVGLLAGDRNAPAHRLLLCIDLTPEVVTEAVRKRVNFVMAYHPVIFKPVARLTAPSNDTAEAVFRCVRAGIAIYSTHTALDAADGGTNDVIAELCGITHTEPFEFVGGSHGPQCKVVVFVPANEADAVAEAMFRAGSGRIGDYEKCSFRTQGVGTFHGSESTNPAIGKAGRYETVEEIRMEAITPKSKLPAVIEALRTAHSYEEPAFDIYPLSDAPQRGIGRYGTLPKSIAVSALARRLKKKLSAVNTQIVSAPGQTVSRASICVGAAGTLPFAIHPGRSDVIITGEIRHHDALAIRRRGCAAIALGHWSSERPVLATMADRLREMIPSLNVQISEADCDPFAPV
jgi:dinuclear metal center YbgI/SA1388 family protein